MAVFLFAVRSLMLLTILTIRIAMVKGQSCSTKCLKPLPGNQIVGTHQHFTITTGGHERSYLLSIPPNYYDRVTTLTPLILSYHGGNRTARDQLRLDLLTSPEFNKGEIVVYPQGERSKGQSTWQGSPNSGDRDVLFTQDLINHLVSAYCIDKNRIYATGKSDGGGFCNVLACDPNLSRGIAAFAPVSGAFYINTSTCDATTVDLPCHPGRDSIPIIEFHGIKDETICYYGGPRRKECLPTIPHWAQEWAKREKLSTENITSQLTSDTKIYEFGEGWKRGLVTQVTDLIIKHDWPSTGLNDDNKRKGHHPASFNATPIILDFFGRYTLDSGELLVKQVEVA